MYPNIVVISALKCFSMGKDPLLQLGWIFKVNFYLAIQAVKESAAQSGSPTQDGQGEKVVESRWQPRNGCDGQSMAKNS